MKKNTFMVNDIRNECLVYLEQELDEQVLNTWIKPLQVKVSADTIMLLAPNKFVCNWVKDKYQEVIENILKVITKNDSIVVQISIGNEGFDPILKPVESAPIKVEDKQESQPVIINTPKTMPIVNNNLNSIYTFAKFIDGKSNRLAKEAASQVSNNLGGAYNPLLIYGGTGLGKSHLMHSIGNALLQENPKARILYMHSEAYVQSMITALQNNNIESFKAFYRNLDCLLIDDIQFFAGKGHSQEEFFHTFNHLLEGKQQIVLTSDVYPKEIDGLEDRLKSRFSWGLTVYIEPPEFETRVAILKSKAKQKDIDLINNVAFFIADKIRSHVRDLEGALNRVIASANFTGETITVEYVEECLSDVLAVQQKLISISNIQKIVSDYYNIRTSDMLSSRRNRSISQPRQLAMYFCKELTTHSLPEIGKAFGGKDHTTVIYAIKKIKEALKKNTLIAEDYKKISRQITV